MEIQYHQSNVFVRYLRSLLLKIVVQTEYVIYFFETPRSHDIDTVQFPSKQLFIDFNTLDPVIYPFKEKCIH